MNPIDLYDFIVDRTDREKSIRVEKLRGELKGLGYSVIQTSVLTALITEARRQGMLELAQ
jgi:hypothetical protein